MAGRDDPLLQYWHLRGVHFHAQVAAGHHDRVRLGDDRFEILQGLRLLDLGDDRNESAPLAAKRREVVFALGLVLRPGRAGTLFPQVVLQLPHILRRPHKAEREEIKAVFHGKIHAAIVVVCHGRHGQFGVGKIDALVRLEQATDEHFTNERRALAQRLLFERAQFQCAVIEQDAMPGARFKNEIVESDFQAGEPV